MLRLCSRELPFWLLGVFSLICIDEVVALRKNPESVFEIEHSRGDDAADVFREVLSDQSVLRSGLTHEFDGQPWLSNMPLSPTVMTAEHMRDSRLATVFSPRAAKWLPRLANGPSIPLEPQLKGQVTDNDIAVELAQPGGHQKHEQQQQDHQLNEQQQPSLGQSAEQRSEQRQQPWVGAVDPPPPEFNVNEATIAGQLASIAYCGHPDLLAAWNCSRCIAIPGFVPYRVVYDVVWDLAAYVGYYTPWDAIVLSFRGTDSSNWGQWAENMRAWRTDHMYPVPDFPHALIHAGFYTLWTGSTLQTTFTAAVSELMAAHPRSRIVATGHSMGGALAQLAGLDFKLFYNQTHTTVYTFGSPRVGNLAYQQLFNSFVDVSWRLTHNRDMVPSVPLQLMGFQHVAREVWEVDVEDPSSAGNVRRKLLLCDSTGEDPSCHNSACYLGLCTSIVDHLEYLGLHMYQDSDEC